MCLSTSYHPQTDRQSDRTIQSLEDMLWAYALEFPGSWDDHLSLAEFSYNNSYHSSIKMPPYEALYGRNFQTSSCWLEAGDKHLAGLDIVHQTTKNLKVISEMMLAAQSHQKSYADKKQRPITFDVGDQVLLKISPRKGLIRFGKRGKLSIHFIGPLYNHELIDELQGIHNTFHVCYLKKYLVEEVDMLPLLELRIDEDRRLVEELEEIVDRKMKKL